MKNLIFAILLAFLYPPAGRAQGLKLVADNGAGVRLYCDTARTKNIGYGIILSNMVVKIRDGVKPGTQTPVIRTKYLRYKIFHDTATWRVLSVEDYTGSDMKYQTSTPTDFYHITADSIAHFCMKQLHLKN